MTKLELAYLAGVIDSDGCITIAVDRWRQKKVGLNPAYQEMIAIAQVEPHAIELLNELFGGRRCGEKPRATGRRPMFRWQATNKIAVVAIRTLLPFLRIKRRQGEIVLALRALKDRGRERNTELHAGVPKARFLTADVAAKMESLTAQVRKLNDTRFPLSLS